MSLEHLSILILFQVFLGVLNCRCHRKVFIFLSLRTQNSTTALVSKGERQLIKPSNQFPAIVGLSYTAFGKLEMPLDVPLAAQGLLRCPVKTEPSLFLDPTHNSTITESMKPQIAINFADSALPIAFDVDSQVFIILWGCLAF